MRFSLPRLRMPQLSLPRLRLPRLPGMFIFAWLFAALKGWVMGSRPIDNDSLVMYDRMLLWLTFGLAAIGFIMVTSASMPVGQRLANDPFLFAKRDGLYIVLAFALAMITLRLPMDFWQRHSTAMLIASIVMLLIVLVVGSSVNGASRWIALGPLRIQPAEFTKLSLFCYIANYLVRKADEVRNNLRGFLKPMGVIFVLAILLLAQPDLGTSILIALSGLFVLFLSGLSWRLIGIAVVLVAAFIPILWFFLMHDYQRQRVMMLLDPETDPLGAGYHIIQSKIAIGSGGLRGKGWLHGTQSQLEFLPERHTDFIFAGLAEELGLIGVLILLALYILLIMRGLWIAAQAQTTFGRVLAGGLMLILFVYVFVNIGTVSGILPVVGVPLPLVSYGGSALIVMMAGFGIVMSIHTHRKMLSKSV